LAFAPPFDVTSGIQDSISRAPARKRDNGKKDGGDDGDKGDASVMEVDS
jgi:hypothetical protein